MEEYKADYKIKNSVENYNVRPGPSNLKSLSASDSNTRLRSFSSHWEERDRHRRLPGKRSHSENDDLSRGIKTNKRETNSENIGDEYSNNNPLMCLQNIAPASQRLAVASMSQQPMSVPLQFPQHFIPSQGVPYQPFSFSGAGNFIDPSQGAYALNNFTSIMPLNSQRPGSHVLNSVASTSGIGISNGMDMVSTTNGNIVPYINIGSSEGSLYTMVPNMQMFTPYTVMNNQDVIVPIFNNLKPIVINHAVLIPPLPGETCTRKPKPNGCRTVYVSGLPEKITKEIIKDAFKICGPITAVRMSKKWFCHIRFNTMESADQAVFLSGFQIKIDESDDPAFNGILYVDYASARDDQHDYECLERARLREKRHRQQEAFRPPSPPDFSEYGADILAERLRNEETFKKSVRVLATWLDKGGCNKKNSGSAYSLIQSSYSHMKRLRMEKIRCKEEVEKANKNLLNNNRATESIINEIEKVFVATETQKVSDQFTRSQRKKLKEMKIDTHDLKQTNSEDLVDKREEEEMEMSDTEERIDNEDRETFPETSILQEKISALTGDLDTAHRTLDQMRAELQNEVRKLKLQLEAKNLEKPCSITSSSKRNVTVSDAATHAIENEQQFISSVAVFLHPFGASIDYICSNLMKMAPTMNARDVESLLRKYPNIFKEVCTGSGASLEKKWIYVGFDFKL